MTEAPMEIHFSTTTLICTLVLTVIAIILAVRKP